MNHLLTLLATVSFTTFENENDALIPQLWAQESLVILENNIIAAALVHRDFSPEVQAFGCVVNTRRPNTFKAARKTDTDCVTDQDAKSTNVAVKLDQHMHTSFVIRDGEESKSFMMLRELYLEPALLSIAQMLDEVILGQTYQFLTLDDGTPNTVGQLGVPATKQTLIAVREKMNTNLVPQMGRNLVMTASTEADLLAVDALIGADKVGDDGTALREASLGKRFGIQHWMDQNTPSVNGAEINDAAGAINNAAGYAAGAISIETDGWANAPFTPGAYLVVAGDATPQRITSVAGVAPAQTLGIFPGLSQAVVDNAAVTVYAHGLINLAAGYVAEWAKTIIIDTVTAAPKVGQLITFQAGATRKEFFSSICSLDETKVAVPSLTSVLPNRPTDVILGDNDVVGLGPDGNYNFAFHKNALTLVTRPLSPPASGAGALSFVASYKGLSVRVTISYDSKCQGHRVTVDILAGVKVLDRRLGMVLLA